MPAKIHLERMLHRNSVAVRGDSLASYALVKLIPAGDGSAPVLPINLALALDVSGSMYEEDGTGISRLKRVRGRPIIAPRRTSSAHHHRPRRAILRQGTLPRPSRGGARVTNDSGGVRLARA